MRKNNFGCRIACTGLDAEISHLEGNPDDVAEDGAMILDSEVFSQLRKDYHAYKSKFVQNIRFNATSPTLGNSRVAEVGRLSWTVAESLRAFVERVIANFRDKNVVFYNRAETGNLGLL